MKKALLITFALFTLFSTSLLAQARKKTSIPLAKTKPATFEKAIKASHIGTWKLVLQKVTYSDGNQYIGDSTMVFQRKIITPTTFVVVIEKKVRELEGKKMVTSTAGGHYTLLNGIYQELTEYATFQGFENMEVKYALTVNGNQLHTVGKVGENMIYDETYIREN
ncbi:hypothetical protein ACVWYG_002051 [Pedobacter sp. UYEF25]